MIELLAFLWHFGTTTVPSSKLAEDAPLSTFAAPHATTGFTVKFRVALKEFGDTQDILDMPNVLNVRLRQATRADRAKQNYSAFKMPDGTMPVLEATVIVHSTEHPEWTSMTIGVPLAELKKPYGEHDVVLNFSGIRWSMYIDGELLDNDFAFGYPAWSDGNAWSINPAWVHTAELHTPALTPQATAVPVTAAPIQYWTPPGHNSWVGDVVTCYYKGRYHLFYLFDRRHHQSKFGKGAHYFEHLSTTDFKTWTQHEAATPVEAQWECIGTGTPFVNDGKLCLAYGLHTTRVVPMGATATPQQRDYLAKNGRTEALPFDLATAVPSGSTYSVCDDGIAKFHKSDILFHPCENPSVYNDATGKLKMLANAGAKGMWESDTINGGWHCVRPDFPPGGDCTFYFHWNKFDYIIGGFKDMWSKPADAPITAHDDVVAKGLDIYDGSNVPSITEIPGGRHISASWFPILGWGGCMLLRELVQFDDGRLGSKWLDEVTPRSERATTVALEPTVATAVPVDGFLLTFDVQPSESRTGRLGVSFLSASGDYKACEFQIGLDDLRAQFGSTSPTGFGSKSKSLREGSEPNKVFDYAIENLIGVDKPFTVRVIVKPGDKIGGSIIDTEIAGARTMLSFRPDLFVRKLQFRTDGVTLTNVRIARLTGD